MTSNPISSASQDRMWVPQLTNDSINQVLLCSSNTLITYCPYYRKHFDSSLCCVNPEMQPDHKATCNKATAEAGTRVTDSTSWACSYHTSSWDHSGQWQNAHGVHLPSCDTSAFLVQVEKTPQEKQSCGFIFILRCSWGPKLGRKE